MAIIEKLDTDLSAGLLNTAQTLSDGAMDFMGPLFRTMVIIYFAIWGYILWTGSVQEPLRDTILRFLRVTGVATVALTAGIYSTYIIGIAFNGPSEIVNGIVGTEYDAVEQLDGVWTKVTEKGYEAARQNAAWYDIAGQAGNAVVYVIFWLAGLVLVVPPFFLILLSKVIMAVLLSVGPVFISMALFQRGVQFTQAWATQLVTYIVIYVLLMILLHVAADTIIRLIDNGLDGQPPGPGPALETLLISLVMTFAVSLIPTIGGGLAGGFAAPIQGFLSKIPGPGTATRAVTGGIRSSRQKALFRQRMGMKQSYARRGGDAVKRGARRAGGNAVRMTANLARNL